MLTKSCSQISKILPTSANVLKAGCKGDNGYLIQGLVAREKDTVATCSS